MEILEWFEEWFRSQCDGEWEHDNRIKIETLDNPGWDVWINFGYSQLSLEDYEWKLFEKSEDNWVGISIKDNVFHASGDAKKLRIILTIFRKIIEGKGVNEYDIQNIII